MPQPTRYANRGRLYGRRWRRRREAFLARAENALCRFCAADGKVEPATVVDHVRPHRGDERLFWDEANWQPLCQPCHDRDKQQIERGGSRKPLIGPDGWPVE